jgi:hypothetical protein
MTPGRNRRPERPRIRTRVDGLTRALRREAQSVVDGLNGDVAEAARRMGLYPETLMELLKQTEEPTA